MGDLRYAPPFRGIHVADVANQTEERAPSPDQEVVLSASNSLQDNLGPSEEADAEFAKELAKLVTDTSAESRKVDKKTALALWDSAVPTNVRKRRADGKEEEEEEGSGAGPETMAFTVITKKGNKQQASMELYAAIISYLHFNCYWTGSSNCCAFRFCFGNSYSNSSTSR